MIATGFISPSLAAETISRDRQVIVSSIKWGNLAATLRWNHTYGPRLFSNTTLYTGNYANNVNLPPNLWKAELGTLSLKTDFTHFWSQNLTAKFGLEIQGYFTTPGQVTKSEFYLIASGYQQELRPQDCRLLSG